MVEIIWIYRNCIYSTDQYVFFFTSYDRWRSAPSFTSLTKVIFHHYKFSLKYFRLSNGEENAVSWCWNYILNAKAIRRAFILDLTVIYWRYEMRIIKWTFFTRPTLKTQPQVTGFRTYSKCDSSPSFKSKSPISVRNCPCSNYLDVQKCINPQTKGVSFAMH